MVSPKWLPCSRLKAVTTGDPRANASSRARYGRHAVRLLNTSPLRALAPLREQLRLTRHRSAAFAGRGRGAGAARRRLRGQHSGKDCGGILQGGLSAAPAEWRCSLNMNTVRPATMQTLWRSSVPWARSPSTQVPFCEFKSLIRKLPPSCQIRKCRRESVWSGIVTSAVSSRPTATGSSPISHRCAIAPFSSNTHRSAIHSSSRPGCRSAETTRQPHVTLDSLNLAQVTVICN